MADLQGTPSDEVDEITALGRTEVSTIFVSLSARDPDGRDLEYLEWHCDDHRPEQHRLADLRGALRVVSTPACRAARIASDARFDAVDHVMAYLFTTVGALRPFYGLGRALHRAGRMPHRLPQVERCVFDVAGMRAAPRVKVGADVLPWWPSTGLVILIERGHEAVDELIEVPGVGGVWWGKGLPADEPPTEADIAELQLTCCFVDDDPAATATRMRPALEARWSGGGIEPLLAAPFHTVDPWDPGRHLPT
jgi:hypothetical protein